MKTTITIEWDEEKNGKSYFDYPCVYEMLRGYLAGNLSDNETWSTEDLSGDLDITVEIK